MAASRQLLDDDGQPSSGSPLHVGEVINGKYRVERQIGRGGMGIVVAATHLQLEHLVAIKVMRRDLVMDDKALDRLLMEARSAARIRSEHVARVLDVGTLENGSPFIVMEYLEGENLADLLDREGALEIELAAAFLLQCCLALAEVHVAEMVHRDLKPGNLFIARLPDGAPTVKIVDFGISKQIGGAAGEGGATTSPQVLGSPFYMSPEQMRADPVDERSDIWGLGAILFEMLTGRPPFIGDTLPEVYSAVLNDAPPNVDTLRLGVPAGLDDVVQRCLEKDPALRFCDVADLAEALAPYAGSAAHYVERITRILTHPEVVRARYSMLPGGAPVGPAGDPGSGVLDSEQRVEGMMAGEGEADGGNNRRSVPDGAIGPPGPTLLEAEGVRRDSVWGASRPPQHAEFSALSATGVRTGRGSRVSKRRVGGLLVALGLLVTLVFLGLRATFAPGSGAAPPPSAGTQTAPSAGATPTPSVDALAAEASKTEPPASSVPSPTSEPRVTPIAAEGAEAPGTDDGLNRTPAAPPLTRAHALQPRPPKFVPVKPSGAAPTLHNGPESARAPSPTSLPADDDFTLPGSRPAAPARTSPARVDPWNPEAFGDRQ